MKLKPTLELPDKNRDRLAVASTLTAIDFETTGAVPGWPVDPWQVGLVTLEEGRVMPASAWESLIHVGDRPFSRHAPGRHRELREALASAPSFNALWPDLKVRLRGGPLVAHQAATERNLLRRLAPIHVPGQWIDTVRLTRHAYPRMRSFSLETVLDSLGLMQRVRNLCPGQGCHDALFDSVGSAVILEHLLSQPAWQSATVAQLTGI